MQAGLFLFLAISVFGLMPTAHAQNASELQLCIFRCLNGSPGADSPEYNLCVENSCIKQSNQSNGTLNKSSWNLSELSPSEPPYLDGRIASVLSTDRQLTLRYMCGRDGDSYLFLDGEILQTLGLLDGSNHSVRLTVDYLTEEWHSFSEFEDSIATPIKANSSLLKKLLSGNSVVTDLPKYSTSFSLKGSSNALGTALRYCAK